MIAGFGKLFIKEISTFTLVTASPYRRKTFFFLLSSRFFLISLFKVIKPCDMGDKRSQNKNFRRLWSYRQQVLITAHECRLLLKSTLMNEVVEACNVPSNRHHTFIPFAPALRIYKC